MKNSWFRMAAFDDNSMTIDLFDEIGLWGISAKDFKAELEDNDAGGEIRVNINSPGGDVFDGIAIYNLLEERRDRVSVEVYGIAASIASVIALAGKSLVMRDGTFFMIHDPWSITIGTSEDHRKTADVLDAISEQIFGIYRDHTYMPDDMLKDAMRSETWYTPTEAVDMGFAEGVIGEKAAASAKFAMLDKFENSPLGQFEETQAESLTLREGVMENTKETQAVDQPVVDVVSKDEFSAAIADITEKLATVTVRPNLSPEFKEEKHQWFYDMLRNGKERKSYKNTAGVIETSDGVGVPTDAAADILMNVNQMSILRKYGAEVRPAGAYQTRFSTVVDSGTASIITESGSYTDKADPTVVTMTLYKLGGRFSIGEEQAEDTLIDMYGAFSRYAARLIARAENAYFISGSGTGQPKGVDEETASVTTAASDTVTFAELVELDESLDPEWDWFTGDPRGSNYTGPIYLISPSTAEALRVLVDSNSNYFFRDHEDGRLITMFGRPVVRTSQIADLGDATKAIALIHPAAYLIGERRPQLAIKVGYDNDTHNITWDFNERVGGQVWDTNGVAILGCLDS